MKFFIFGHSNLLGTHRNTFEFTKESNLTKEGDCIIGVNCNFSSDELMAIVAKFNKLKVKISSKQLTEEITCDVNKDFSDEHEIVIRKTSFLSKRTLGINADKAAKDLSRELIRNIKESNGEVEIIGA
jgi:hypothetical protein